MYQNKVADLPVHTQALLTILERTLSPLGYKPDSHDGYTQYIDGNGGVAATVRDQLTFRGETFLSLRRSLLPWKDKRDLLSEARREGLAVGLGQQLSDDTFFYLVWPDYRARASTGI